MRPQLQLLQPRLSQPWLAEIAVLVVALASSASVCLTQEPKARFEFEVASIRPRASADGRAYVQAIQGRLSMVNFSLQQLIFFAYDIPSNQVLGLREWMASNHFDIQATTESNATVKQMEGPMLQALLEERFQLRSHRETMERPLYELVVEKGGLKMPPTKEGACTPYAMDSPPPVPAQIAPGPVYCNFPHLAGDGINWTLDGTGVSIQKLAVSLSRSGLDRPVVDRTGIEGGFDLHLRWAADSPASAAGPVPSDIPAAPSVLTALKEQLGLKLESAKGPVEILVIDHVEKPSEN